MMILLDLLSSQIKGWVIRAEPSHGSCDGFGNGFRTKKPNPLWHQFTEYDCEISNDDDNDGCSYSVTVRFNGGPF